MLAALPHRIAGAYNPAVDARLSTPSPLVIFLCRIRRTLRVGQRPVPAPSLAVRGRFAPVPGLSPRASRRRRAATRGGRCAERALPAPRPSRLRPSTYSFAFDVECTNNQ